MAGQELVKQDAERINIACRSGGLAPSLLRAGIIWSHQSSGDRHGIAGRLARLGRKYLRNAEVEKLDRSIGPDQDVARLDVAMNDALLVGVLESATDFEENRQTVVRGEPSFDGRYASAWLHDLAGRDPTDRSVAGEKLRLGGSESVPVLTYVLTADAPPEARWRAADVLGQIGVAARPAGPALVAALQDPDPTVRGVVARALEKLAPEVPGAVPALIERFPEVDVFHASRMFIDEEDRPISEVHAARDSFSLVDFETGSPVKHPLCWRLDLALELGGFDESLDPIGIDDYDFPWTMAEAGARFMAIEDCLYLVRDHRDGFRLTTHVPRSVHVRALRQIMRKHGVERARI